MASPGKPGSAPARGKAGAARAGKSGGDSGSLLQRIQAGELDPIYCLTGSEGYLVQACVRALRRAVVGDETSAAAALAAESFDLKEQSLHDAILAARTRGLLGGRRLVHARGIDLVPAAGLESLRLYAETPNPDTCLVLTCDKAEKLDGRLKTFAALRKAGFLHEFGRLSARELPGWIEGEARRRGLRIEPDATQALAEAIGSDLGLIAQALEQLGLYVASPAAAGATPVITRDAVATLIPSSREHQNYELTDAIGSGQTARALQILHGMFASGGVATRELPILLQGTLANLVRQLWRAGELLRAGTPPGAIGPALGLPPWLGDKLARMAPRYSARTLMQAIGRLYENDRALKSSRGDARVNLSRLVRELSEGRLG